MQKSSIHRYQQHSPDASVAGGIDIGRRVELTPSITLAGEIRAVQFAQWLDPEFANGDEYIVNLIAVSFLENLPWPPDANAGRVAAILGRSLTQELQAMQAWRPDPDWRVD